MAQRSNFPRRVRRKLVHNPSSASDNSISRVPSEDVGNSGDTARSGQNRLTAKKILLCLDYGTTMTSISYITFDPDNPPEDVEPRAIRCIANWPGADRWAHPGTPFVRSESWYWDGKCLWGYEVQNRLYCLLDEDDVESINCVVQLPKLLFDDEGKDFGDSYLAQTREALLLRSFLPT
ncbi:hypothetical protein BDV18DRAFT_139633 [Aspergillus unguis]